MVITLVTCERLSLGNGTVTYNETMSDVYSVDTVATFVCDRGFDPVGSTSSSCQTSGEWSEQPPACDQGNREFYKHIPLVIMQILASEALLCENKKNDLVTNCYLQ